MNNYRDAWLILKWFIIVSLCPVCVAIAAWAAGI